MIEQEGRRPIRRQLEHVDRQIEYVHNALTHYPYFFKPMLDNDDALYDLKIDQPFYYGMRKVRNSLEKDLVEEEARRFGG